MRETINGADLRRMIISAAAAIEINKQALNELNVFPVPDGDTGNTFSESTYALFFSSRAAPVRNISFRSAPFIVVLFKSISSMHSPLKGMRP